MLKPELLAPLDVPQGIPAPAPPSPATSVDAHSSPADGDAVVLRTKRRLDSETYDGLPSPVDSSAASDNEDDSPAKRRRISESSTASDQTTTDDARVPSSPREPSAAAGAPKVWHSEDGERTARRGRTRFTETQLEALEAAFAKNDHPNLAQLAQIAACVGVSERSAKVWFQNRRAKERKASRPAPVPSYRGTPAQQATRQGVAQRPRLAPLIPGLVRPAVPANPAVPSAHVNRGVGLVAAPAVSPQRAPFPAPVAVCHVAPVAFAAVPVAVAAPAAAQTLPVAPVARPAAPTTELSGLNLLGMAAMMLAGQS